MAATVRAQARAAQNPAYSPASHFSPQFFASPTGYGWVLPVIRQSADALQFL